MSCYLLHFFRISLREGKAMQMESVARAIDRLNRFLQFCDELLRLLSTKYGTSRKKTSYVRTLKETMESYISM